jgi:UDP-N-acetylmuramate dehydrogenase
MIVEQQYSLRGCNTLALASAAKYCIEVNSLEDLRQAIVFAKAESLPVIVLGEGSNVVLAAQLDAVVILMRIRGRQLALDHDLHRAVVTLGAGENWHDAVCFSLDNQCYGLENLALIPGLVGAAPVQNIGAYGRELSDFLLAVTVFNPATAELETMTAEQCQLSYRESVFKRALGHLIIVDITLELSLQDTPKYGYQALQQQLARYSLAQVSAKHVFDAVVAVRTSKLPNPAVLANAGSFFKNPIVSADKYQQLLASYPAMVGYPQPDHRFKLAAGWLIDHAGWRGRSLGPVAMHKDQALVLVNNGGATIDHVMALVEAVRADCCKLYGLSLDIEPRSLS